MATASLSGAWVAGVVGYGAYSGWFFQTERTSFKSRINTKERIILNETHTSVWTQLLAEYKDKTKAKNLISGVSQDNTSVNDIKSWCSNMHESKTENKAEFNSYVSWCTRENLITKLKGISKNWNTSTDDSGWSSTKSSYNSNQDTTLQIPSSSGNTTIAKDQVTVEQLKNYCKSSSSMPFIKEDDTDYKRTNKWCTNP